MIFQTNDGGMKDLKRVVNNLGIRFLLFEI